MDGTFLAFTGTTLGMTVAYLISLKVEMPFIQRISKFLMNHLDNQRNYVLLFN